MDEDKQNKKHNTDKLTRTPSKPGVNTGGSE